MQQRALVTAGAADIGREIVRAFLTNGAGTFDSEALLRFA
jgi:NAD(P)-dependent dehydrogenase (short-subunit alcohol dehydrogenase family)